MHNYLKCYRTRYFKLLWNMHMHIYMLAGQLLDYRLKLYALGIRGRGAEAETLGIRGRQRLQVLEARARGMLQTLEARARGMLQTLEAEALGIRGQSQRLLLPMQQALTPKSSCPWHKNPGLCWVVLQLQQNSAGICWHVYWLWLHQLHSPRSKIRIYIGCSLLCYV